MKYLILFTGILVFVSCKQEAEVIPADVIDQDKFVEVMKDRTLAEAALNVNPKNITGNVYDSVYNFKVYKENGITSAQYDSTLKYYSSRPDEFKVVMEAVLEKLNMEKAKR